MLHDAETWVAIGFLIFIGVLAWHGVHDKLLGALDARIDGVKKELAEAQKLRDEAQALLASFEAKRKEAEAEAAAIVAQAKQEAELLAKEAQVRTADFIARRTKQAEDKIAQAEAQAASDVRSAAADAAVKAAETVLKTDVKGAAGASIVDQGIKDIGRLLH
ncbi:MAG: ATP F0F1 synthase subunit B [Hyphomicrobiales bacterium]|nr:ATP F0F1 synthase subunit B [Hyphomicrobiales bacterium]